MNFLSNMKAAVNERVAAIQESKEFQSLVAEQTKPIRRRAYLEQKMIDAITEGHSMASKDTAKKIHKERKPEDFGIGKLEDPLKYLKETKSMKNKK